MTKARVVIEGLTPQVDCGRFPARRVLGDTVIVEADVFADGHDAVAASMLYRHESETQWHGMPMILLGNDRWQGRFTVQKLGRYFFGWFSAYCTEPSGRFRNHSGCSRT